MPTVHLLNVAPGDCTIIQHPSGRTTMIDICDGNLNTSVMGLAQLYSVRNASANQRMCDRPTNPIDYVKKLGGGKLFRFILTHPDMDHMDGFNRLIDEIGIVNYWDSGARKSKKPDFAGSPYREEDWDRYVKVRDGKEEAVTIVTPLAGAKFSFANLNDGNESGGDGLYILAPDTDLLNDLDEDDDLNDASYVLLYRSPGVRIVLPGDAHDLSCEYVMANFANDIRNSSFLLAPHHGRDSDRSYDFLDVMRPRLTLIGCSPSEYIDYDQWRRRGLEYITSNQAGNVVLEISEGIIDVYVENESFAISIRGGTRYRNSQGYAFLTRILEGVG